MVLELISKWDKEKAFFDKAIIDPNTGTTWPYIPTTKENAYRNWLKDVTDPATNQLYKGKDVKRDVSEDGVETFTPIENKEPYEEIYTIVRVRTYEGKEFLLSKGRLVGFNEFGKERRFPYTYREEYTETIFKYETDKDEKTGKLRQFCHGPAESRKNYLMPFTPNNVDKLWSRRDLRRCQLVIKNELSGEAKECPDIEMFKTKDFDYIMNMGYLTEKERGERLEEFRTLQGELTTAKSKK